MFIGIKMPRLSETSDDYKIMKVFCQVGDAVKKGDLFAEVETDKATMPVCFYNSGKITEINVKAGDVVRYNSMMGVLDEPEK